MPRDRNIQLIMDANPGTTEEEAIQAYTVFKGVPPDSPEPNLPLQPGKPVTSGQVLAEENRPFERGLETTRGEFAQGLEETTRLPTALLRGRGEELGNIPGAALGMAGGPLRMTFSPLTGLASAAGTTTQNILAQVPGLGGASGNIPAGAAALTDAAIQTFGGPAEFRLAELGTTAIARLIKRVPRLVGELLAPAALREAGVEVAMEKLGLPATSVERITQEPVSKALFAAIEHEKTPLATDKLVDTIGKAIDKEASRATPNALVMKQFNALFNKYNTKLKETSLLDIKEEAQQLALWARAWSERNPAASQAFFAMREKMLEAADEISPAIRAANKQFRLEETGKEITAAMRTSNAGVAIRRFFEQNPGTAKILDAKTISEIEDLADKITNVASGAPTGIGRQSLSAGASTVSDMFLHSLGRKTLRASLRAIEKKLPEEALVGLTTAVQLWRSKQLEALVPSVFKSSETTFEQKVALAQALQKQEQVVSSNENVITPSELP